MRGAPTMEHLGDSEVAEAVAEAMNVLAAKGLANIMLYAAYGSSGEMCVTSGHSTLLWNRILTVAEDHLFNGEDE